MTLTPSALTHRLLLTLTLPVRAQSLVERMSVRTLVAAATDSGLSHQVELVLGRQLGQAGDLQLTKVATVVLDAPLQPMQPAQGGASILVLIYLDWREPRMMSSAQLAALQVLLHGYFSRGLASEWEKIVPDSPLVMRLSVSRLELKLDLKGHDWGQEACVHYVVQTDVEKGWMGEIEAWYDKEHMPGLAAVPGCRSAQRLINHDSGPRSYACYDLASADVLTSTPWMAVRGTAWSSMARPHFVNPQRWVMRKL
jgi:hypothetical protein